MPVRVLQSYVAGVHVMLPTQCNRSGLFLDWDWLGNRFASKQVISWLQLWPKLAAFFGLESGPPMPLVACRLPAMMKDKGPIWDRLVQASGASPRNCFAAPRIAWTFAVQLTRKVLCAWR